MSSRKKQSHARKHGGHGTRTTMPKRKELKNVYHTQIQCNPPYQLNYKEKIKTYINSLQKDIKIYALRKGPDKSSFNPYTTIPKNLLTQIQRKLGKLEDLFLTLKEQEPKTNNPFKQDYKSIQQTLEELGYPQELEKFETDYKSKNLIKNSKTNHYPNMVISAPFLF